MAELPPRTFPLDEPYEKVVIGSGDRDVPVLNNRTVVGVSLGSYRTVRGEHQENGFAHW
jgi:hypothetical protein